MAVADEDIDKALESSQNQKKKLTEWKNEPTLDELQSDYKEARSSHDEHVMEVKNWLDNLYIRGSAKPKTREGYSQIQPKVIRKNNEWRYSSLSEPFLSTDDIFNTAPVTAEDAQVAIQNGLVLNYQFNNEINKQKFIDELVRTVVDEGTAIVQVGWDFQTKNITTDEIVWDYTPSTEPLILEKMIQMDLLENQDPGQYALLPDDIIASHEYYKSTGELSIAIDSGKRETVNKQVTIKNSPSVRICDFRNIIIDPDAEGELDKAEFIIHSYKTSYAELKADGSYQNLDTIEIGASSVETDGNFESGAKGEDDLTSFILSDKPRKKIVAYEYWGYRDINNNGDRVLFCATWVGNTLIKLELAPVPDNKMPFVAISYMPVKGSNYGEPDGELLDENQKIIGALSRGMIDVVARVSAGQRGTRKGVLDAVNKRRFKKGEDYEYNGNVDTSQLVHTHKAEELPASVQILLANQYNDAESLSGVKAFSSSGITGNALGDSVGGARHAMDAAAIREMGILRRLAYGVVQIGKLISAFNAEFLDEEKVVRITNNKFIKIKRDDLMGHFDVSLSISTPEADDQKGQELAFMLQTLGNNVDFGILKILLAKNARLRKMPDVAQAIENYEPQPDPLEVQRQQLEIALLQQQLQNAQMEGQHIAAKAANEGVKVDETVAKTEKLRAEVDQISLNVVEQESGVTQEREKEKIMSQSEGNINMKVVEKYLDKSEDKKDSTTKAKS